MIMLTHYRITVSRAKPGAFTPEAPLNNEGEEQAELQLRILVLLT